MQEGVSDNQYFQAANFFKNKLKIDYVTLKYNQDQNQNSLEMIFPLKNNLI